MSVEAFRDKVLNQSKKVWHYCGLTFMQMLRKSEETIGALVSCVCHLPHHLGVPQTYKHITICVIYSIYLPSSSSYSMIFNNDNKEKKIIIITITTQGTHS